MAIKMVCELACVPVIKLLNITSMFIKHVWNQVQIGASDVKVANLS